MSLSTPTFSTEIENLNQEVLAKQPTDIVQFCANYFNRRLESQRAEFLASSSASAPTKNYIPLSVPFIKMSGTSFPGRLGGNAFSFGSLSTPINEQGNSGSITKVTEEDENDLITSPTTPNFNSNGAEFTSSVFGGDGSKDGPPSSFKLGDGFPEHYGLGRRVSVSAESLNPTASANDNWSPPVHPKTPEQVARLQKAISGNFLFSHLDEEQSDLVLGALQEKIIPAVGIKVQFRCVLTSNCSS